VWEQGGGYDVGEVVALVAKGHGLAVVAVLGEDEHGAKLRGDVLRNHLGGGGGG
jgi:hypothetical protein